MIASALSQLDFVNTPKRRDAYFDVLKPPMMDEAFKNRYGQEKEDSCSLFQREYTDSQERS